jgi:hypothetical protein
MVGCMRDFAKALGAAAIGTSTRRKDGRQVPRAQVRRDSADVERVDGYNPEAGCGDIRLVSSLNHRGSARWMDRPQPQGA